MYAPLQSGWLTLCFNWPLVSWAKGCVCMWLCESVCSHYISSQSAVQHMGPSKIIHVCKKTTTQTHTRFTSNELYVLKLKELEEKHVIIKGECGENLTCMTHMICFLNSKVVKCKHTYINPYWLSVFLSSGLCLWQTHSHTILTHTTTPITTPHSPSLSFIPPLLSTSAPRCVLVIEGGQRWTRVCDFKVRNASGFQWEGVF